MFRGDYSAYHRQRLERDARAAKDAEGQAGSIEREKELIQRYRSHRKFSKMHEHEARLERLQAERVEAPKSSRKLRLPGAALAGGGPSRSGEVVVRIEDLVVGYLPGRGAVTADGSPATEAQARRTRPVPRRPARATASGSSGRTAPGKTTLLRTIAGDLPPIDGRLSFGNAVQIGYLAQLRGAAIPGATVIDALLEAIPITPGEARGYLARFLFRGDDAFKEVRALSGGERSRLELALLGIMPSNLLLLDEPTNHLDIPAREAIEAFMTESPATLLVVSHDRRLLETICTKLWVVDGGLAAAFDGGYREWRAAVAAGWTVAEAAARPPAASGLGGRAVGRRRRSAWRSALRSARIGGGAAAGGPASEARQAVQGRVSAPEGRRRRGPQPARAAQEPSRARHGRSEPWPRTSSSCGGSPASSSTSTRPWRTPRTPGSSSRNGRRDRPHRHHGPDRLRQVDGRRLARRARRDRGRCRRGRPRGHRAR